jgi:hypothetical protein
MRRTIVAGAVAAAGLIGVAAAGTAVAASPRSSASPSADLSVSGSVAGGERSVESFHPVVFVFNLTNKGPSAITSSADLTYTSVVNGTVTDQLCIMPNGNSLNADSPACEPGQLAVGQTSHMTLIVQPNASASGSSVRVRVCSSNESSTPDPVSSNNCKTLSVAIE